MKSLFVFKKILQQFPAHQLPGIRPCVSCFAYPKPFSSNSQLNSESHCSTLSCYSDPSRSIPLNSLRFYSGSFQNPFNLSGSRCICVSRFSSYSSRLPSRTLRKRINKRRKAAFKASLDRGQFERAVSQLLPRFRPEELHDVITREEDPLVCLELFNWASQQPRFEHDVCTFHVTVRKLGAAKMYEEMDSIVTQVLDISSFGSEALYNTMIYFFTEARKLSRAIIIYKHMRSSNKLDCRPSIRTYNLLLTAFLSRRSNTYINHMYMGTIRGLFKQMINDGVDPDIFSLNSMIKGYVLSLHINDALRIFHQMGVVYDCQPNAYSYDYLIHGLCAQGRTENARKLCNQMKEKGFVPSCKSYNSLVNALALEGDIDKAVSYLWEMIENQRSADFMTFRTVMDEICRVRKVVGAMTFLKELQVKDIVNEQTYRELHLVIRGNFGNISDRSILSDTIYLFSISNMS